MIRRLLRRTFTLLSVASLLLCVAVAMLWVRSYARREVVYVEDRQQGPTVNGSARLALALYERQGWGKARDRYWKDTRHELHVSRGRFAVGTFDDWCVPRGAVAWTRPADPALGRESFPGEDLPLLGTGTGVEVTGNVHRRAFRTLQPSWPLWPACALTLVPPGWLVFSTWRRRRSRKLGHCPACGYDLRATPGRCPECGAETPTRPQEKPIRWAST